MKYTVIGLVLISSLAISACSDQSKLPRYTFALNIMNNLKTAGYFSICSKPTVPGGRTICSIPQKIQPGINRIYIPRYQKLYPVFTTHDESSYTCGTPTNPEKQLFFNTHRLILDSFVTNNNKQNIAIVCK